MYEAKKAGYKSLTVTPNETLINLSYSNTLLQRIIAIFGTVNFVR
jgi:hypothetical protein